MGQSAIAVASAPWSSSSPPRLLPLQRSRYVLYLYRQTVTFAPAAPCVEPSAGRPPRPRRTRRASTLTLICRCRLTYRVVHTHSGVSSPTVQSKSPLLPLAAPSPLLHAATPLTSNHHRHATAGPSSPRQRNLLTFPV